MRVWQRWEQAPAAAIVAIFIAACFPAAIVFWWGPAGLGTGDGFTATVGVTFVAYLTLPTSRWPLLAACTVVVMTSAGWLWGDDELSMLIARSIVTVVQTIAAVMFVNIGLGRSSGADDLPDLSRRRDLAFFIGGACVVGPLIGAAGDVVMDWIRLDEADWADAGHRVIDYAAGIVVIAPLFLVWHVPGGRRTWRSHPALALAIGLGAATAFALAVSNMPVLFLVLAGLILAGAFFDVRTVALSAASIAIAISGSVLAYPDDLMGGLSPTASLTLTKIEFILFALAAYLVAAESNEHLLAEREASEAQSTLTQLQLMLLPPLHMEGGGYRVRGTYDPAQRKVGIGGDWYLARVAIDGQLVFAVGDIVGHDLRAAQSMASVRSGLVLEAATQPDPRYLLDKLDSFSDAEPSIRFSTAWFGVYDPINRTLDYACAGHPPPLLVANERVYRLDRANTALVGLPQGRRVSATTFVPPGSSIVLYTDGLVERRHDSVDSGIARLESVLLRLGAHPDEVLETMLSDSERDDDSAIAVIDFDQVSDESKADRRLQTPTRRHTAR